MIHIDFLSKQMLYRKRHATVRREKIARALGLKNTSHSKKLLDATAGLAQDSFIIASLGFEITLLERSPVVYAAIVDAMTRAKQNPDIAPIIQRMHLIQTDAITWLSKIKERPDVIYLDPMFPQKKKSAAAKKEMRLFHDVVGEDLDAEALFHAAFTCAIERVVVKRPRLASPLSEQAISFSLTGSSCRFDIYLTAVPANNTRWGIFKGENRDSPP